MLKYVFCYAKAQDSCLPLSSLLSNPQQGFSNAKLRSKSPGVATKQKINKLLKRAREMQVDCRELEGWRKRPYRDRSLSLFPSVRTVLEAFRGKQQQKCYPIVNMPTTLTSQIILYLFPLNFYLKQNYVEKALCSPPITSLDRHWHCHQQQK